MGRVSWVWACHEARVWRRVRGSGGSWVGTGVAGWSGQCGEFPESGEDLGEQVVTGRRVQNWLS